MKKLYGVITAMTTPFTKDGKLDVEALKEQTEFTISKGVNCLYPTGTTGEMNLMTEEERKKVAETVVNTAAGKVTVYIHVGAMKMDETIRLAQHAEKIGADGIGVVTPIYFNIDDRAMIEFYKTVCKSVSPDFPVYAYAIPQLAHNGLSIDVLNAVCKECKNFVGIKYSYPDMGMLIKYMTVNDGNFSVVFGADHMFLPALAAGADGTVSGCSGPFPEFFVDIYRLYNEGKIDEARKVQTEANTVIDIMKYGGDMSIFKNILKMRGVPGGHVRRPLLDLTDKEVSELKTKVEKYIS